MVAINGIAEGLDVTLPRVTVAISKLEKRLCEKDGGRVVQPDGHCKTYP